jgi:hypothetical protein
MQELNSEFDKTIVENEIKMADRLTNRPNKYDTTNNISSKIENRKTELSNNNLNEKKELNGFILRLRETAQKSKENKIDSNVSS